MSSREKREREDIKPFLFKFGVTVAISLGGIVYSVFKNNLRIKQSQSPPDSVDLEGGRDEKKIDQQLNPIAPENHDELLLKENVSVDNLIASLSPSRKYNEEKDEFLISEFMELVKEFDVINTSQLEIETREKREDYEEEINKLRNTVKFLKEKERSLEFQLLEYYGLKEQEIAFVELQNRLKIKITEAKHFALKVESLQEDNRRLKAQVADHAKIAVELDLAMKEIELLKRKLRSIDEHNKEQLLVLKERVQKMQEDDEAIVVTDVNTQISLQRLSYLEEEAQSLRMSNQKLLLENSDLAQKLEHTQMLANSVLEDITAEAMKKESDYLRKETDDLKKEVDQLKTHRCADAEELVYLKWINACLRYELRNYHPEPTNKTVASDLSKTLSPKSEEKAKQLILEYANIGTNNNTNTSSLFDFDSDEWSSSSQSNITDSSSIDNKTTSTSSTKMKVFHKLKKLLERGKPRTDMNLSRSSSDIQTITRSVNADSNTGRRKSDVCPEMDSGEEKLVKYAEVIRDCYGERPYNNRVRRVSSSVSF